MNREDAIRGVGLLVAATNGWSDETVELYVAECAKWADGDSFLASCHQVATNWREARRPPLPEIRDAYQSVVNRRAAAKLELDPPRSERIPSPAEGVEVARAAYHAECYRLGKEPSDEIFDTWAAVFAK